MLNKLFIEEQQIKDLFEKDLSVAIDITGKAFIERENNEVIMPIKTSQIFDEAIQNRINCMTATLLKEKVSGVKWVSVFPNNPLAGLPNVIGTMLLSELEHGTTIAIMEAATITEIRTSAVGALAAKLLAKENAESIGFIGAGREARRHLELIKLVCPTIKKCYVSSRTDGTVESFINEERDKFSDVEFVSCSNNYEKAIINADIIVTATSTQKDLLKAKWIKKGALYIHVGGWEDEYAVALKADKIICDEWDSVKHRSQTISRMYKEKMLTDKDIYADIGQIVAGKKLGRENNDEFIYFNSVGMAYIDVMFAKHIYDELLKKTEN